MKRIRHGRKLIFLLTLALLLTATITFKMQVVKSAERCDTVRSVCTGQADLLNELCKAMGGSTQDCLRDFITYVNSCMTNNDCPIGD
jgi:hypothetical protein